MKLQRLLCLTRKAVDEYHLIEDGDRIAVGISGGKDSLTLLYALHGLKRFYPKKFEIIAVTIDLGFEGVDFSPVQALCSELGVEYHVLPSHIAEIIFDIRKESNPCSLCAKLRRGQLYDTVKQFGCNKVAYGHHMDDFVETMLLSLTYEARFFTFSPMSYMDRTGITVIRPMMFVPEEDIKGFVKLYNVPVVHNPCPADGYTRRQYMKDLLADLNRDAPGVKERMFHAVCEGNIAGWPEHFPDPRKGTKGRKAAGPGSACEP